MAPRASRVLLACFRRLATVSPFLLLLVLFVTTPVCGQNWVTLNSGTTQTLTGVHFRDSNNGWIAGGNLTLMNTTDGGANWSPHSPSGFALNDCCYYVHFLDASTGWAGGVRAAIRTTDGGTTWGGMRDISTTVYRNSFSVVSPTLMWAGGWMISAAYFRTFYRYSISGSSVNQSFWTAGSGPYTAVAIYGLAMIDADNGWGVGQAGTIYRITNGSGGTPTFTAQTSGVSVDLGAIEMLDSNTGWVVGNSGTILKTIDGGATWTPKPSGTTSNLLGVDFADSQNGWAVGKTGTIIATTDGGETWHSESSPTSQDLNEISVVGSTAWAVGMNGTLIKRVTQIATTTTVSGSPNPATYGASVTLTGTVSPSTATGTVTFMDGASTLGSGSLSGGTAQLVTSSLSVGDHSITAVYAGDSAYSGSTSAPQTLTVNRASTTTSLGSSLNPAVVGDTVTFTATVTPSAATGNVQFMDGASVLNTVTLSGGTATFSTSSLTQGSHSISAVYGGDSNYAGSTSSALNQAINSPVPTLTSISPNVGSTQGGTTVTLTGTRFLTGATVTFGGVAGTNVTVTSPTSATVTTPAHTRGLVDVTITNPDQQTTTLAGGFRYGVFDANGDTSLSAADAFYLINHLFANGPAPSGGASAGDADGNGVLDARDVFYLINYLFAGGPEPN